jgi:hypothetical protein
MRPKAFAHRQRLAAVPAAGFIEVLTDSNEDVGAEPEYMPLSLLGAVPTTGASPVFIAGTPQALTAAGAVTVTEHKTDWTTTGADAGTLADGTIIGQIKVIQLIVDGGSDGTLTPANFADGDTIIFADAGDTAELIWDGSDWNVLDLYNRADGATAPVVA